MRTLALPIHCELAAGSRLPVLAREQGQVQLAEILALLAVGTAATLADVFLDFHLRIPGNAIVRAVFPMAFGLALAPRRMAGTIMGAGALTSAVAINVGGWAAIGFGAMTSLTLAGPILDLSLWRARRGWRLYVSFALAGLGCNMVALAVRAATKLSGLNGARGRPFAEWFPQAIGSYAVCGVLAGLISALVWFQLTSSRQDAAAEDAA